MAFYILFSRYGGVHDVFSCETNDMLVLFLSRIGGLFLLESIDFATDATDGVQKTQPWKEQEEPRKGNDVVFAHVNVSCCCRQ